MTRSRSRLRRLVVAVLAFGQLALPLSGYAAAQDPPGIHGFGGICSARTPGGGAPPAMAPASAAAPSQVIALARGNGSSPDSSPSNGPAPSHQHAHCVACAQVAPPALTGRLVLQVLAATLLFGTPAARLQPCDGSAPAHADARAPPLVF